MIFLCIFIPFLSFFFMGKPFQGILCLLLQITLIGWLPASLWAVFVYFSYKLDKQHKELLEAQNKD
ncbi:MULTISPECIES: YqaE/Pmp3 family membrane protein [Helicobacter]|uniref:YqaE/Pmp3 family membrane protein n=1 Tax=Helicobacter ibis TaxID=2962633 RepID=A0ABT4VFW2_9HELI|nr:MULTISPECIES: YqaE/Pmp3 family membrane protein [Helicobacter]MDA3967928.1 YqaE/Pmp3 family membrane protein [Helicobacter sp. WB40]MDA3969577.1 YqaE/Pmp3 family membrane protein [Helicobacter ibis]